MIDPAQAQAFLTGGRIAVVGASDEPKNFGRTIVSAMHEHGIEVVAVHPRATSVAGVHCYPSLAAVPGLLDGVIVMVAKDVAPEVIRACADRGVRKVWLFKGAGPGAVSDEALQLCLDNGMSVVAGACPLMFLEPVRGVHKLHRSLRRLNGSVGKAA
jgi:predicted CoA-binding protein